MGDLDAYRDRRAAGRAGATIGVLLPRAEVAALARGTRHVLFIARGTSDNAAVYGSYLVQSHAGRLATLASPSIATVYRSRVDLSGVLAVGCPSRAARPRSLRR
jgi:fructoselysine-6-P-deglycase FrlB-like protein